MYTGLSTESIYYQNVAPLTSTETITKNVHTHGKHSHIFDEDKITTTHHHRSMYRWWYNIHVLGSINELNIKFVLPTKTCSLTLSLHILLLWYFVTVHNQLVDFIYDYYHYGRVCCFFLLPCKWHDRWIILWTSSFDLMTIYRSKRMMFNMTEMQIFTCN